MSHLRLVPSQPAPRALAYTTRRGVTFYLHQGKTKTGKPRYWFAKSLGEGALTHIPEGFELTESLNGVVSLRRVDPDATCVPPADLETVRAVIAAHPHLAHHGATINRGAIIVHEPEGGAARLDTNFYPSAFGAPLRLRAHLAERAAKGRRVPVLRFEMERPGAYVARRMTYRGEGGWSWPLAQGTIAAVARKLVPHLDRESFFDL